MRKPNCTCLICQKPIYRKPNQIKINKGNVYCSRECMGISNKKIGRPCPACDKPMSNSQKKKYCSHACSNRMRAGIKYHIGAPNNKAARAWRLKEQLLAIRPNKCNRCPYDKIKFLVVHHIVERSIGGSDDLTNLELLCSNCHVEHHNGRYHID